MTRLHVTPGKIPKRSARWHLAYRTRLRQLAERDPGLVWQARELGRIRAEWEQAAPFWFDTIIRLHHAGLSYSEIGQVLHVQREVIVAAVREWRKASG